ncbi:hypothetical protein AB7M49_002255 [Bradyrhizobium elkanii]
MVSIARKLDAIGEPFGKIIDKLSRSAIAAISNVETSNQFRICVERDPGSDIARVARSDFGLWEVARFDAHEAPNLVHLHAPARKMAKHAILIGS